MIKMIQTKILSALFIKNKFNFFVIRITNSYATSKNIFFYFRCVIDHKSHNILVIDDKID
jgi:hypothetical protein